jgi:hypothetical protein
MNFNRISKNLILKPKYKIILNPLVFEIINRTDPDSFVRLGDISISTQGLSPSRFKEIDESNPLYSFPYLKNGNVYNYTLVVEEKYQTSLKNMESLIPFYEKGEKILIRRIVNRQDRLSVGFTDERLVFKKDINPFIIIDKSFLTKYVLAILASKFISYFYVNVSAIALKDDFRQTTLSELREILIPKIGLAKQEKFANLADKILSLKKQNPEADTTVLEAEIDRMVYALYGLTEEEVKVVEGV